MTTLKKTKQTNKKTKQKITNVGKDMNKLDPLLVGIENGIATVESTMAVPEELKNRTLLVAQWIRIHLPMQKTWVPSLLQEDSTYGGATEPSGLRPARSRAHEPQRMSPCATTRQQEKPPQ